MDCKTCGKPTVLFEHSTTLVGYCDPCPKGYGNHDDNCVGATYRCADLHNTFVWVRNTCECGWKGKATCGCHNNTPKVELNNWKGQAKEASDKWQQERKSMTPSQVSGRINEIVGMNEQRRAEAFTPSKNG